MNIAYLLKNFIRVRLIPGKPERHRTKTFQSGFEIFDDFLRQFVGFGEIL